MPVGEERTQAWADLAVETAKEKAPWWTVTNRRKVSFVSDRVGNYIWGTGKQFYFANYFIKESPSSQKGSGSDSPGPDALRTRASAFLGNQPRTHAPLHDPTSALGRVGHPRGHAVGVRAVRPRPPVAERHHRARPPVRGQGPVAERRSQQVRENLGLDEPFFVQYANTIKRLVLGPSDEEKERLCPNATEEECKKLVGRLGRSFEKQRSVDYLILQRLGVTFSLTLVAAIIWLRISIPVGILSAMRPRSIFDRMTMVFVLIGQSLPIYYFGLLGLYFFAFKWEIFPLGGYEKFSLHRSVAVAVPHPPPGHHALAAVHRALRAPRARRDDGRDG